MKSITDPLPVRHNQWLGSGSAAVFDELDPDTIFFFALSMLLILDSSLDSKYILGYEDSD